MLQSIRVLIITTIVSTMALADVFMTELADPNNSANSRFIELYNNGDSDVDLSSYKIRRYTNANAAFKADGRIIETSSTLDADGKSLTYVKIFSDEEKTVVELKYDQQYADGARGITEHFPFRVTKNSKYVIGVERIRNWKW